MISGKMILKKTVKIVLTTFIAKLFVLLLFGFFTTFTPTTLEEFGFLIDFTTMFTLVAMIFTELE